MIQIKKFHSNDLVTYFISFFFYNFARVLPHAVLTVILLDKGMSIGNIAFIQSFFMIAVLLFEFPSGILTDIWSEKNIYLIALFLLAISYFLIMISHSFLILCLSWFIYGISSASISGSLETYFLKKYQNNESLMKKFNINLNNINLISGLIGGGIGSFIYAYIEDALYVISILFIIVSAILIIFFFRSNSKIHSQNNMNFKNIITELKNINDKQIYIDILLFAIFQIIAQLFFQFWQVMFLSAGINKKQFGIFYIIFQLIALFSNFVFGRINFKKLKPFLIIFISVLLILGIYFDHVSWAFVILILLFLLPFNIYSNQLFLDIQKQSPSHILASVMSFAGTIGSIVSMIFLWVIGVLDHFQSFDVVAIESIMLFMVLSLIIYYLKKL
ncbi:MFS transporter [Fructilactobacillus sanfranciscensis]|nr:MFS transporter [Fructilactobacillus sanfranciscensis]MVF16043.1 MFS transporter [Fructilactobacillus sanfranciscensis]TNK95233.1 MFS transporter [Fructilactobacillus sanfranciscensis]TNK98989.1 MFS transporter [Fructilactobacillus sanfranciscensis]